MTSADIFRDWRVGMIAGAALLHLTAFAGAWVMVPHDGVETRLNRPIEASLMPAPSNDAVNEVSSPLSQEVVSPVAESEALTEDTVTEISPDAVAAEPAAPHEQSAESPPVQVAEEALPTPVEPDRMAALVPDVVTTTSTQPSATVATVPDTVRSETVTEPKKPMIEKPIPEKPKKKVEKPKEQPLKTKAVETPVKDKPEVKRLAKLDTTTQTRHAQKGGEGAMSDIGVADSARTNGAAVKKYNAILVAAVNSRVRAMGGIACQGGRRANVGFNVSASGSVGSVRLSSPSGDSALDRAALAAVRGISPPPPPGGAVSRIVPVQCPRS
ncbi:TonB family protein [Labrys sp. (in: a-proteobacteria)]|uniref:energy transducer TonB family protein n=1 Tax=Labrys sp. (in: a-proteobacteria) TaxID=1917972 RepID=UPI0039E5C15A